eukprot:1887645-Rhodomonas_salina.1
MGPRPPRSRDLDQITRPRDHTSTSRVTGTGRSLPAEVLGAKSWDEDVGLGGEEGKEGKKGSCLLYTSDAADDM